MRHLLHPFQCLEEGTEGQEKGSGTLPSGYDMIFAIINTKQQWLPELSLH